MANRKWRSRRSKAASRGLTRKTTTATGRATASHARSCCRRGSGRTSAGSSDRGCSDPEARPGLARWAERLHAAAYRTVTCSECSGSYFCDRDRCSWCDASRPSFVMARVLLWDPEKRHAGGGGRLEGRSGDHARSDGQAAGGRDAGHLGQRAGGADRAHHPRHVRPDAETAGSGLRRVGSRLNRSMAESGASPRRTAGSNVGSVRRR